MESINTTNKQQKSRHDPVSMINHSVDGLHEVIEHLKATTIKESLFYLTTPLKHIDFHITDYWTSSIWSL